MPQPATDGPQPAVVGVRAEQDLGDGLADELAVGQPGPAARSTARLHQLIDGDVQCDDEVVETGVHTAPRVDGALAALILGGLGTSVTSQPPPKSTSLI
jgi:hypothetical protein